MEWRIRQSANGDFYADRGVEVGDDVEVGFKPGFLMKAFVVYESHRFDTRRQAERFAAEKMRERPWIYA